MGLGGPGDTLLPPKPAIRVMKFNPLPPYGELLKRFTYDPDSGELFYNKELRIRGISAGAKINNLSTKGYLIVTYNYKTYSVSRIIWKMFYMEDPPKGMEVDHINRIRTDNRISNLRVVTPTENKLNRVCVGTVNPKMGNSVILTTPEGIKKEYISISAAARDNKLSATQLTLVAKGKRKGTKGYTAEFIRNIP
jgi:hypothetical protein